MKLIATTPLLLVLLHTALPFTSALADINHASRDTAALPPPPDTCQAYCCSNLAKARKAWGNYTQVAYGCDAYYPTGKACVKPFSVYNCCVAVPISPEDDPKGLYDGVKFCRPN